MFSDQTVIRISSFYTYIYSQKNTRILTTKIIKLGPCSVIFIRMPITNIFNRFKATRLIDGHVESIDGIPNDYLNNSTSKKNEIDNKTLGPEVIQNVSDDEEANIDKSAVPIYDANTIIDESCDDAPYPEVRAVVSPFDDPSMPVNTFRAWFLGIISTIIGSGVNQFFSMRYPSVTITSLVCQLVSYPIGQAFASIFPMWTFNFGRLGKFQLNPDRKFNVKEHTLITIMANISFTSAWATDIIQAQVKFYNRPAPTGLQVLMVITCQLFGLGVAGLVDDILVKPSSMIWPSTLANVALFDSIHSKENAQVDGWKITRIRFFLYVFIGSFIYYWLPGYIFTALSTFAFICWAAPGNIVVNQIFGMQQGLGLSLVTFDWAQIAYNLSPILTPVWAQLNVVAGWIIFFVILPPILYYKNSFYSAYLPMSSSTVYDHYGNEYNGSRIIDANGKFILEKYKEYSPVFLSVTYAISYGCSFAVLTAGPVYVYLQYGTEIWSAIKGSGKKDIHVRLMERYKEVPKWWYILLTLLVYVVTIVIMEKYHTQWPVWGITLALVMVLIFILPIGIIYAITNTNTNCMTVLGQIISGYALPGLPIVALTFKFYAYTGISQAMAFSQDMKLGYYMKIPKRSLFWAQFISCVLGALVQVGVLIWMFGNISDLCDTDQSDGFTCPQGRTNFAASVVWGAVGPSRTYGVGQIYSGFLHLFWIGALLPIITYFLAKRYPNNIILKNLNWVVLFGGTGNYPPATGINYASWACFGLFFNYFVKRKWGAWWSKYVFVMSCALDVGVALAGIIIFFALSYPGVTISWWGNNVNSNTADGLGTPYKSLPETGYFGPDSWS